MSWMCASQIRNKIDVIKQVKCQALNLALDLPKIYDNRLKTNGCPPQAKNILYQNNLHALGVPEHLHPTFSASYFRT